MPFAGAAQVRLPALWRDSMVIQRETPVRLWGWASAGEEVKVAFNHKSYRAKAAPDGQWSVRLSPTKAGGPYTLSIDGHNHIDLHEILVGDVWVCSGQSNMVHQLSLHRERYAAEIAAVNEPWIRQFHIPTITDLQAPRQDLPASYWKSATGREVLDFSAVAYFFAKQVYDRYHIPIGIINASVGGSPIEAWMSRSALAPITGDSLIRLHADTSWVNTTGRAVKNYRPPPVNDEGLLSIPKWSDSSFMPQHWHTMDVPGYWEDGGLRNLDGIVWFTRSIEIPEAWAGQPALLALGRIVDADQVYMNGVPVGNTTYQYPQRRYAVPAGLLKAGRNTVTVRIVNNSGKGGFVPDKPYELRLPGLTINLKGSWQYRVGAVFPPQVAWPSFQPQNEPTALYNAMLAPVTPFAIKGVLWYQGESNTGNAAQYGQLLQALIGDWRRQFHQPDLPFLYVQLPNFGDVDYAQPESGWALVREGQLMTLSLPNTAMAITIDLGEWNDVHPDRKKEVGERLALLARRTVYGEKNLVASGPLPFAPAVLGDSLVLRFSETGSGLVTEDGGPVRGFLVAGTDKKFVTAEAYIMGDKVIVWSPEVKRPVYVRYAWADNPAGANLYNREGLPASPFRTDH